MVVDDFVAHADDLRPRNLGASLLRLWRNTPGGLSDDLDQMGEGKAQVLILVVVGTLDPARFRHGLLSHIQHMSQVDKVILLQHMQPGRRRELDPEFGGSETWRSRGPLCALPGAATTPPAFESAADL